jgi:hypothetical protein
MHWTFYAFTGHTTRGDSMNENDVEMLMSIAAFATGLFRTMAHLSLISEYRAHDAAVALVRKWGGLF